MIKNIEVIKGGHAYRSKVAEGQLSKILEIQPFPKLRTFITFSM